MFTKEALQQSRLLAAAYGREHLTERLDAVERMNEIHEERPDFFTASFLTEMWERAVYQYNVCATEGIHFLSSKYEGGISFDKIKR